MSTLITALALVIGVSAVAAVFSHRDAQSRRESIMHSRSDHPELDALSMPVSSKERDRSVL